MSDLHIANHNQTSKGLIRVVPIHNSVPNGESLWNVQTAPPDSPYPFQDDNS